MFAKKGLTKDGLGVEYNKEATSRKGSNVSNDRQSKGSDLDSSSSESLEDDFITGGSILEKNCTIEQ